MVQEIRDNLDKVTGELLESFVPFDKEEALHFQTGLYALYKAQEKVNDKDRLNLYSIHDKEKLQNLLEEHGIKKSDFALIPELINNPEGEGLEKLPEYLKAAVMHLREEKSLSRDVPAIGMIAVMLNLVNDEIKNVLLASQAAERTLRAVERAENIGQQNFAQDKKEILDILLYGYGSEKFLKAHIHGTGNEPGYLVAARAINHIAEIFEGILNIGAICISSKDINICHDILERAAINIFNFASQKLESYEISDAGKQIKQVADHFVKKKDKSLEEVFYSNLLRQKVEGFLERLESAKAIEEQEKKQISDIIELRFVQINKTDFC